jgi:hypothetical protein
MAALKDHRQLVLERTNLVALDGANQYLSEILGDARAHDRRRPVSIHAIDWSVRKRRHIGLLRERATTLADLLQSNWDVTGLVGDLPDAPRWIIDAASIEALWLVALMAIKLVSPSLLPDYLIPGALVPPILVGAALHWHSYRLRRRN